MTPSLQQQLAQLKSKHENEVKKNNNLLKMNSNLMKENEIYQNFFASLKKWAQSFFLQYNINEDQQQIDQSCIDIEEEGQQFVRSLTAGIQRKIQELCLERQHQLKTQRDFTQQSISIQPHQCNDCERWKDLYIKESKQTSRLQKLINQSSVFTTKKQLNIVKLKDDVTKLLEDYLKLYQKQLKIMATSSQMNSAEAQKISNRETVRIENEKSNEKRSGSSGNKPKKIVVNVREQSRQKSAFSKQKTSRNTKYNIQLSNPKQENRAQIENLNWGISPQIGETINKILSSYSEVSKDYEEENILLKEQLREFNQILTIYREKERNKLILK